MNTLTRCLIFAAAFLGIRKHPFTEPEKKSATKSQSIYTNTYRTKINIKNPNGDVDSVAGWCLPPFQVFAANRTKESDKELWAERDDYCRPETLFHSSTVAVKSLRQQTAGWDAVVPQEKSKAGLNNDNHTKSPRQIMSMRTDTPTNKQTHSPSKRKI